MTFVVPRAITFFTEFADDMPAVRSISSTWLPLSVPAVLRAVGLPSVMNATMSGFVVCPVAMSVVNPAACDAFWSARSQLVPPPTLL